MNTRALKTKQRRAARYHAISNAAAFIENHGEEGGLDENAFDFPIEMYLRECKRIAEKLHKQSMKYQSYT